MVLGVEVSVSFAQGKLRQRCRVFVGLRPHIIGKALVHLDVIRPIRVGMPAAIFIVRQLEGERIVEPSTVGRLVASDGGEFIKNKTIFHREDLLPAGRYEMEKGIARVMFDNGASVTLTAPAEVELVGILPAGGIARRGPPGKWGSTGKRSQIAFYFELPSGTDTFWDQLTWQTERGTIWPAFIWVVITGPSRHSGLVMIAVKMGVGYSLARDLIDESFTEPMKRLFSAY